MKNIAIIGASGAIAGAMKSLLQKQFPAATLHTFSQSGDMPLDYSSEASIANAAEIASQSQALDLVFVTNGILHSETLRPEKSLKEISADNLHEVFHTNTIIPALLAKHFLPKLNKNKPSIFASLSARVGSVSDNQLGGWYSYRISKAALNMMIKNTAIETGRTNKNAIIVGLHPGTVDSELSKPFQRNVPPEKLFSPEYSAQKLLEVMLSLTPKQSGKIFAWDGQEILP